MLAVDCDFTKMIYHALKKAYPNIEVIFEEPVSKGKLIRGRIKKLGVFKVLGQLIFQIGIYPFLKMRSEARIKTILQTTGLSSEPIPLEVVHKIESANDMKSIDLIKYKAPALVIINGTRILSKEFVQTFHGRIINIHAGITPAYRGVHGAYWALVNNDPENCGTTVHFVDSGIDTGNILAQAKIEIEQSDNFATYPYLQFAKGINLLMDAVQKFFDGSLKVIPVRSERSALWFHPTFIEYFYNRKTKKVK
ncbi:formyl transferase domain-containing protein [Sporocytophaga myxococcoides]|uniref:phosphoribosylglycinamide formyltransferase 1 n=1 Tax=Sporocytophaga myxococcoides TaxID=153721 RepID=A0A098LBM1_9BACT|nr:formyl transferase domain-containing protein [Sporocytophaga myxococcoides]